jgi:hypothetical protein
MQYVIIVKAPFSVILKTYHDCWARIGEGRGQFEGTIPEFAYK